MAARLKHQRRPYPVKFAHEMLAPLGHAVALELRSALCHDPHGVATGVRIYANKFLPGWKHFHWR
jgi:hypothetical protein